MQPTCNIALIMVSHNDLREEGLRQLGRAIAQSPLAVEVIVVDNASTSYDAHELVKRCIPHARIVLRHGDHGYGRSCNRGAARTQAEYVFLLNPDTGFPDPAILQTLYAFAKAHPWAGILAPKIIHFDGELQHTCRRFPRWYMPVVQRTSFKQTSRGRRYVASFLMHDYEHDAARMVDWAQGSALFMPKAFWDALGGFDDRFWMYFEDIDLCRRSWMCHRPVYYVPEAVISHAHGRESAKVPGLLRNIAMNKMARAHIASWLKYLWKWNGRSIPAWR